jgi:ketosteroid isomerase-like protein
MESSNVQRWLDAYVAAWKSYDRAAIEALFSEDVEYRYHPYDEPVRGREEVVKTWLGDGDNEMASSRDAPGTYDANYAPAAIDGDVAVAVGVSTYTDPPVTYDNCFLMQFDADGRCSEFTEFFMKRPTE